MKKLYNKPTTVFSVLETSLMWELSGSGTHGQAPARITDLKYLSKI